MKRSAFISVALGTLCVPAFAKKKRRTVIAPLGEEEPGDFSYGTLLYSVNSSYPYEQATLVGPDFSEGMILNRVIVQGALESFDSFKARLIRIVDALEATY